ncbi:type VI secretion system tip protein TssI/VgrG [Erwiniaceae bacterium CAU 1747]
MSRVQSNDSSSCWIRVTQPWAGQGWGMLAIPRIGQEVVVDFLHGDPDQPIVTGRTYHASNVPPGSLPGSKTQMALRSKTHKGQGYNELLFEDATGAERLSLHAQKDMTTLVKNDQSLTVEGGNRTLNILAGDETKTVKQGSLTESICSLRSTRANQIQVKAEAGKSGPGTQLYESSDDITLKVGACEIKMTTSNIKITFGGSCIQLDAGGVFIDGKVVHLNKGGAESAASGNLDKSVMSDIKADAENTGNNNKQNQLTDLSPSHSETSSVSGEPKTEGAKVKSSSAPATGKADGRDTLIMRNGNTERRTGGTLAWRNNNPGNIRAGDFATSQGAIGTGPGGFAIFPDEKTGNDAVSALLQTKNYRNLNINDAISRYAPPVENNTAAYQRRIQSVTGLDGDRIVSSLNADELDSVVKAIRQHEGWRAGAVKIGE